jgi:hypothetical protein
MKIRNAVRVTLVIAMVLIGAAIVSAQTTGSITLTGTVSPILEITVTPVAGYDSLDLTITQTNLLVATVNEKSNNAAGYSVSVASTNAAATSSTIAYLEGVTEGETLDYTISYGGAAVLLNTFGEAIVTDVVGAKTTAAGVDNSVQISYTGGFLSADSYSDTLTFTITAK